MPRPKLDRAVVSTFKGMDVSVAPSKLPPGLGAIDLNGMRTKPYVGSWRPRRGATRMVSLNHEAAAAPTGAVLAEGTAIMAVYQFQPNQSWSPTISAISGVPHLTNTAATTTVIALTKDGNLVAHSDIQPRGAG